MKIAFIVVFFYTLEKERARIKKEIENLRLKEKKIYFIDNTKDNMGYAAAVNKGIRIALKDNYDFFVIMNPDISLVNLRSYKWEDLLSKFDIGGYALKQNGKIYYGGEIDKLRMSGGLIAKKPELRFKETDFVSGSLMLIKKKVVDTIGLFNESYFMYYEDVEYCYRAKKAGFKVGIDSSMNYLHHELSSSDNEKKQQWLFENRIRFLIKYGSWKQKLYEIIRLPKTIMEDKGKLLQAFFSRSFFLNFFSLNFSSFIIRTLNFILFLFFLRFFNAEEYGIYTLVWAQVMLLAPLVDFGTTSYGVVYLSNAKDKMFNSLFSLRLVLSIVIFLLTITLAIFIFGTNLKVMLYVLVTSSVIFTNMFSGSYFIWNAIREKAYISSRNSIIFQIIMVFVQIIGILLFRRMLVIFFVIFFFYNLYSIANFWFLMKEAGIAKFSFPIRDWLKILKKSYVFVLISFFAGLYFKLDIFLLAKLKGQADVGIYSAGYKFFEALLFIPASYNVSVAPVLSRLKNNRQLFRKKIVKDIVFLTGIGLSISVATLVLAPVLLPLIFKSKYQNSMIITQIVMFALPIILLNSIWMNVLYVLNKAYLVIFVFILQVVINLIFNLVFIPEFSYFASSLITVLSEIVNCMILLVIVKIQLKKNESEY